jgi:hypothetical protein
MDTMDRFDVLAARRAHGTLSEEESRELDALVKQYPKLGQRLVELDEMDVFLKEFAPLLESVDDAPAAQFPEHRMGQFTSAVWQEFRHQVPERPRFSWFQWALRHSFALSAACAMVLLVATTLTRKPEQIVIVPVDGGENAATRIIEFGVYNPVTELDYAPEQLLSLLNVDTRTFLSGMEKLNNLAKAPVIKPLSFEMADAFEQWKGDDLSGETLARVWVDPNMERLYIMQRQDGRLEQTVRDLPRDSGERDKLIRSTIQTLSRNAVDRKAAPLPNENA